MTDNPFPRPDSRAAEWTALLLDWLFPPHCRHCEAPLSEEPSRVLCSACLREMEAARITGAVCEACGLPHPDLTGMTCGHCTVRPPAFDRARALYEYRGPVAELVKAFKFRREVHIGVKLIRHAAARGAIDAACDRPEVIVAVPLHPVRQRRRGFNQAQVLAEGIRRHFPGARIVPALRRLRDTDQQAMLTSGDRRENVRGAFGLTGESLADANVLLVDDVMTTGATVNECARTLRKLDPNRIDVLTLARATP